MKNVIKSTLALLLSSTFVAYAGDDFLGIAPESDAPSLGQAVLNSNQRKSTNLFLEATGGALFGVNGDFSSGVSKNLDKGVFGGTKKEKATARLNGRSIDDIYDSARTYSLRVGMALGNVSSASTGGKNPFITNTSHHNGSIYLRFAYTDNDGGSTNLGRIGDCDLTGRFSDYQDWGLLVGFEKNLLSRGRITPYIGGEVGVRFVDGISVDLLAENDHHGHDFNGVPFYDDSVVFTAHFTVGVDFDITDRFALGIESGIRYQTGLDQDDSGLNQFDLAGLNNADASFWAVPVMLTGRFEF